MSTETEITRLQASRDKIRKKLVELNLADSRARLDELADAAEEIENKGGITETVREGETFYIPQGFHDGSGSVSGVSGDGNYQLQHKEVTPTKSMQVVKADEGNFGLSAVAVKAIPDEYEDVSGAGGLRALCDKLNEELTAHVDAPNPHSDSAPTAHKHPTSDIIPGGVLKSADGLMTVDLNNKTIEFKRPNGHEIIHNSGGSVFRSSEDADGYRTQTAVFSNQIIITKYKGNALIGAIEQTDITPGMITVTSPSATCTALQALGYQRTLTAADDLNSITENGIYYYSTSSVPKNAPYPNASVVEVFGSMSDNTQKIQRVSRYGTSGAVSQRSFSDGTWLAWYEFAMQAK